MRSDVSRTVLETVLAYHERTKHHPHSYARSLGYLDWDTQPNPFRRYEGSELLRLDEVPPRAEPPYRRQTTNSVAYPLGLHVWQMHAIFSCATYRIHLLRLCRYDCERRVVS